MPPRALVISIAALSVPLVSAGIVPEVTGESLGLLIWVCALVPGFLMSYHRGWTGSAVALAAGMAVITLLTLVLDLRGLPAPSPGTLVLLVGGYIAVSVGLGLMTEMLHRERRRAQEQALTDPLTQLPNRRHAEVFLDAAASSARLTEAPLSVVLFDVDHLKWLNDTHGHSTGDEVLRALAGLLESMADPRRLFARYESAAFIAVLTQTTAEEAVALARTVGSGLAGLDLRWQPITVSVGVAEFSQDSNTDGPALLAAANEALSRAKERGRDRIEVAERLEDRKDVGNSLGSPTSSPRARRALVVLPGANERTSIRRVLELNGLHVDEFGSAEEVPLQLDLSDGEVALIVSSASDGEAFARVCSALDRVTGEGVPRVLFAPDGVTPSEGAAPEVTCISGWPPSGDRLLPILSGLLTAPVVRGPETLDGPPTRSRLVEKDAALTDGLVLVVDDERSNRMALQRTLENLGFQRILAAENGALALERLAEDHPDLLILDLHMPGMDGFQVLEALRGHKSPDTFLPILVVTGDKQWEHRQRALSMGAKDFLNKPFDVSELGARVLNLLETRRLHLQMREINQFLERRVWSRTRELERAKDEILFRLAQAAEYRDDVTGKHATRVGAAAAILAEGAGLDPPRCDILRRAAPLHDVGKIAIPDAILLKEGPLTPEERKIMQGHTTIGARLLQESTSDIIECARVIALSHHERWDGAGYPKGLRGAHIPIEGQIVAVVDALDALTHTRPYQEPIPFERAEAQLLGDSGTAFAPPLMEALVGVRDRLRVVMSEGV